MKHLLAFAFPLLFLLVVFQNCGDGFSSQSLEGEEVSSVGDDVLPRDEIVAVPLIPFLAGETVALNKLPYQISAASVARLGGYLNSTDPKMIAFTDEGDPYIFSSPLSRDQAEATRVGLERCQLLFERLCSLYAEGNIISQDQADFMINFTDHLPRQTVFDPLLIPALNVQWQEVIATNYSNGNNPFQAIAISKEGAVQNGWSSLSQDEANRRALEFCQTWGRPCTLYAVANQVVFDYATLRWSPNLIEHAPSPLNNARIPFITESQRLTITPLIQGLSPTTKFVIALGRYGQYDIKIDNTAGAAISNATRMSALADCNLQIPPPTPPGRGHECFIYSEGQQITMTQETLNRFALRIGQ